MMHLNIVDVAIALDENTVNTTAVTDVSDSFTGTDFDRDGEAITYSITGGNTGGAFGINTSTGVITVTTVPRWTMKPHQVLR